MGFGSSPKHPGYVEQADTPWITSNRQLMGDTYNNIQYQLPRIDVMDDATKAGLNSYIDDIYNRAASDFDRNYSQTMNKYLQRDYNRFGTTGASSSLLNRDNYNLQRQRALADLAYNRAETYNDFLDAELKRRYNNLLTNYGMYTDSGKTIQDFDNANWKIRNTNRDVKFQNDVRDYNRKNSFWNSLMDVGSTAASFIPVVGPAVSSLGYSLSDALFPTTDYNAIGYYAPSNEDAYDIANSLWGMYGSNWQNATNRMLNRNNTRSSSSRNSNPINPLTGSQLPISQVIQALTQPNVSTPYLTDLSSGGWNYQRNPLLGYNNIV